MASPSFPASEQMNTQLALVGILILDWGMTFREDRPSLGWLKLVNNAA
jgi:hypothetical protein